TLELPAHDFAAHIGLAGVVVGHHALGCRQNGDAQTVVDTRQIANRHVDAAARLGDALDFADHRLPVEIFQLNLELGAATGVRHTGVTTDEPFGLEHFEHALALLGARHRDFGLVAHLRVADTRDHVAEDRKSVV